MRGNDFSRLERLCPGYTLAMVDTHKGFHRCVDLQIQVWHYDDAADVVPFPLLAITNHNGGTLIGAYSPRRVMVGFVYAFLALHRGQVVQHSHMLGVLDRHRNRNLGLALKLAQRQRALKLGISRIVWTFDPLQSLNAHFNFSNLGIQVETYEVNIYGRSSSVLHQGLDTDRFLVSWDLDSTSVRRKVRQAFAGQQIPAAKRPDLPVVNTVRHLGQRLQEPVGRVKECREGPFLFEIPTDINHLRVNNNRAAVRFQRQLRSTCQDHFKSGYAVTDFFTDTDSGYRRCFYLFTQGSAME